jgi:hypothetical protein
MDKNCFRVSTVRIYDEFAAMMGSEDDAGQAPGEHENLSVAVALRASADVLFAEELSHLREYGDALEGRYKVIMHQYGPRGCRTNVREETV